MKREPIRDERGWSIPDVGTFSRRIYDSLVAGKTYPELIKEFPERADYVRAVYWRIRNPDKLLTMRKGRHHEIYLTGRKGFADGMPMRNYRHKNWKRGWYDAQKELGVSAAPTPEPARKRGRPTTPDATFGQLTHEGVTWRLGERVRVDNVRAMVRGPAVIDWTGEGRIDMIRNGCVRIVAEGEWPFAWIYDNSFSWVAFNKFACLRKFQAHGQSRNEDV